MEPERVLVIEDDQDVSALIQHLLSEDGLIVQTAGTGEEGITLFSPQEVDLVVLDAMLPGLSGWEVCQRIKDQHAVPYVPVLMLTARAALRDRVRGLEAGADDYLTKPFDIDELLAHVRAMLRIRRAEVKLWRHARDLEALNAIAGAVNSSLDLEQILSLAVVQLATTAGARVGTIWLQDEDGTGYSLAAHTGLAVDQIGDLQHVRRLRSLATRVVREGKPLAVEAPDDDDLLGQCVAGLRSVVYLPLTSKETTLGLLALGSDQPATFGTPLVQLLTTLVTTVAVATDNARLYTQTRRIADTDSVTSLYNHRFMQDAIETEIQRANRSRRSFAITMVDLDNFKAFNDTFGHPAGDQLLRDTAKTLTAACRKTDRVGRYGGDEFILLLPETNADQAGALADRIQASFAGLAVHGNQPRVPVSLSIGIAVYPFDSAVRQDLIKAADQALYQAKRQGGGRARVAGGSVARAQAGAENPVAHLESLIGVVDSRTGFSRDHAELSARYAALLARHLGLPEETQQAARLAGLLHDVGNIGVPAELLSRGGPLSPDEYEVVKQHVILSEMLIEQVPHVADVVQAVIHHHERWDGGGYPRGLRGEQIPLLGRLMMVVSAYAAMVAPRPYRDARDAEEALAELVKGAGRQFDPALVAVMRRVVSAAAPQAG